MRLKKTSWVACNFIFIKLKPYRRRQNRKDGVNKITGPGLMFLNYEGNNSCCQKKTKRVIWLQSVPCPLALAKPAQG